MMGEPQTQIVEERMHCLPAPDSIPPPIENGEPPTDINSNENKQEVAMEPSVTEV